MFHSDSHPLFKREDCRTGGPILSAIQAFRFGEAPQIWPCLRFPIFDGVACEEQHQTSQPGTVSNNTFSPHARVAPYDISMEADAFKFDWSVLNCGLHCWYD